MTREESQLVDVVARIIDMRRAQVRINPAWIATEALKEIDPANRSVPLVSLGCHLQLRQIARSQCRKRYEPTDSDDEAEPQFSEFKELQERYPTAHSPDEVDQREYVLRDHMTAEDVSYNVARLRREARAKLAHADALEAWGRSRGVA